jgi:penicillin-binding protein 2
MSLIPPSAPGTAQKDMKPRLIWATGTLLLSFLVLLARLYYLQILRGDEYKERAENNYVKEFRTPADRGQFLDRNGVMLVDSRPSYNLTLTPYFCRRSCDEVLDKLAALVQLAPDEVDRARSQLKSPRGPGPNQAFAVKADLGRDELDRFLAHQMELPGADVQPVPHRNYRYAGLGGHLIGYMNEVNANDLKVLNAQPDIEPYSLGDYIGRRGLEYRYESVLRGEDGKERMSVDAKGFRKEEADTLIPEDQRVVPSVPGHNLVLSIDWRLQEFAEKTFPATAGVVAAMDAKTGFLLALVDRPAPDPNKMSGRITPSELAAIHNDPLQPELFRAIQQHYHPGSTFKALIAIAALEEGVMKPGTTVFCPGHFNMGKARWRCDKESGHGNVDFEHALGASCDVFFYQAGALLGADAIAKWARRAGLGMPTGFDVKGEISGVIPDAAWHDAHIPGGYQRGMAVNLAIGQGDVNVTPMQQLVFYAALATGKVWRPQVVLRVQDADGKVEKTFAPDVRGTLDIKPSTREVLMKGLLAAVNQPYGTAYGQRVKEFTVAGKTGTAQVVKLGAHRVKAAAVPYFERDHAWFASFAPAEDPEIVVVVLNEHSGFGSTNAAPTAVGLIKKYMELKALDAGLPPPVTAEAAAKPGTATAKPEAAAAPAKPEAAVVPAKAGEKAPVVEPAAAQVQDGAKAAEPKAPPRKKKTPAASPEPVPAAPPPEPAAVPTPDAAPPEPPVEPKVGAHPPGGARG